MSHEMDSFTHRLARAQDEHIAALDLHAKVRERVITGARPRVDRTGRRLWLAGGAAAVVGLAVAASAVIVVNSGPQPLTATHGGEPLTVGAWIDAKNQDARLDFSDGTVVVLDRGSAVRVAQMTDRGALLMLERGTADLDVVHTGDAEWTVQAGPYTIAVTGTAFETSWEPDRGDFELQMRNGSVWVTGPDLGDGVAVSRDRSLALPLPVALNDVEPDGQADEVEELIEEPESVPVAAPQGTDEEAADWFSSYEVRDYAGAVEVVRRAGLDGILATETPNRLLGLADAASRTGDPGLQTQALQTLRARFPGTSDAADGAFLLGRIQEQGGDLQGAATWFRTAHDENPDGRYGEIALGSHMNLLDQAGEAKAAKQAAIEYLDKYPTGTYAHAAKRLAPRKR